MKPILFNTEMVRAILEGRKTVTRRIIKPHLKSKYKYKLGFIVDSTDKKQEGCYAFGVSELGGRMKCVKPPYKVGDVLYVRETCCKWYCYDCGQCDGDGSCDYGQPIYDNEREEWFCYCYKANGDVDPFDSGKWTPSIHMPKEAARIFLRVTDVRVERLQDITEAQAEKEGCEAGYFEYKGAVWGQEDTEEWTAIDDFSNVWQSTIKRDQFDIYGWNANPYVWVIEFERIEKPAAVFN